MLRVLLVEDNRSYRESFKEHLCDRYPRLLIEEAENGEEAVKKINESPPDLVFMDLRLPGMNGLRVTQEVKKDFPNVHIVMLTGYDVPEYREAATQYGAEGFFVKESIKWDEVKALVESIEKTF